MLQTIKIDLTYQPYIGGPPTPKETLYKQACSADDVTITSWHKTWIDNTKANYAKYGKLSEHSIARLYGKYSLKPAIICGAGPHLKNSLVDKLYDGDGKLVYRDGEIVPVLNLRDTKGIPIISCLHNFHYLEDNGVKVDYYVSLDAGDITLDELSQGGKRSEEEYYALTKDKTLCCFIGTSSKLLSKWQGEILWFNAPIPSEEITGEFDKLEPFHTYVSNGGNVLGACLYIAKAICGANPIIFTGASFSFSYDNHFHGWDSPYDINLGQYICATDVYGVRVKTWQSYWNFKCWFDWVTCHVSGIYINSTEGGIFGAFPEGNIRQVIQMPLRDAINMYTLHEHMREQCENPATDKKLLLF